LKPMTPQEAAERFGAENLGVSQPITGFATDSRSVGPGDLFLAIRGHNVDGHEFAPSAYKAGAAAVLCERPVGGPAFVVPNLVEALAKFGLSLRKDFAGPVVGITGSAGKTTTKELTGAALAALGPVLKTKGNQNTEYTSPLAWAELTPTTASAVIEMGMRGFGQIRHLAGVSRPTIGIITFIGTAHLEMVGSREGIARAKGELLEALPSNGTALLWDEDDFLLDLKLMSPAPVLTFGFTPDSDSRIIGCRTLDWGKTLIRGRTLGEDWEAELPLMGRHQAQNAAAAILAARLAGASVEGSAQCLAQVELPPMRLELARYGGAILILDFYNASPDSTVAALRTLSEAPARGKRYAVLGEMKELGDYTEGGHRLVGQALASSSVDFALLAGEPARFIAEEALGRGFPPEKIVYQPKVNHDEIRGFLESMGEGDVALIKGSRALGLEKAIPDGVVRG
jgi:UDP-N-acetylmuramoyl-tripeptide--D-alanyl-D-alanine ligase